jgi:hypothetical protein
MEDIKNVLKELLLEIVPKSDSFKIKFITIKRTNCNANSNGI